MISTEPFGPHEMSEWFWGIIERAEKDRSTLKSILQDLPTDDVYHFALEFMLAASYLRGEPFTAQIGYGSEDHIEDMSHWVVSQGKQFYTTVWHHPEAVAIYVGDGMQRRSSLEGVAEGILDKRLDDDAIDDILFCLTDDLDKYYDSKYTRIGDFWAARQAGEPVGPRWWTQLPNYPKRDGQ